MTDNKRVTNKQILDKIDALKVGDEGLNVLAIKIVSRMVKLKSMEDWFSHVSKADVAWSVAYDDLDLEGLEAISGSVTQINVNSPFLDEIFKGDSWKKVMKVMENKPINKEDDIEDASD